MATIVIRIHSFIKLSFLTLLSFHLNTIHIIKRNQVVNMKWHTVSLDSTLYYFIIFLPHILIISLSNIKSNLYFCSFPASLQKLYMFYLTITRKKFRTMLSRLYLTMILLFYTKYLIALFTDIHGSP